MTSKSHLHRDLLIVPSAQSESAFLALAPGVEIAIGSEAEGVMEPTSDLDHLFVCEDTLNAAEDRLVRVVRRMVLPNVLWVLLWEGNTQLPEVAVAPSEASDRGRTYSLPSAVTAAMWVRPQAAFTKCSPSTFGKDRAVGVVRLVVKPRAF